MKSKIHIGIVGAGANTVARHIPGLKAISDVEIVSVCNRTRASSEKVAEQFDIRKITITWQELIADPDIDAVVIGTWPYLHCRATIAALKANKHVMCEARMAMNASEARRMLRVSQNRPHLVAQLVPAPFTLRVDNAVKRILLEGHMGDPLVIHVRDSSGFLDRDAPLTWRQDFDLSGFNTMTLGIWYEIILRWFGEATSVMAQGKTVVRMRKDASSGQFRAVRIPEHLEVSAEMACGAQAHFTISRIMGFFGPPELSIYGSKGTLRFSEEKLFGAQKGSDKMKEINIPAELAGGWRVEEEFINAIKRIEPITYTRFEDGVKYMEFTEAVARSLVTGRTVSLPLF